MPNLSDTPQVLRGYQDDPKRVFYSDIQIALTREVFIVGGYGVLKPGTVLAEISSESSSRAGQYVPYSFEDPSSDIDNFHGAYLLADGADSTSVYVTQDDSYKFAVGDHLAVADGTYYGDSNSDDLGAITAIDRTTYTQMAVITVTNNLVSDFTIAKNAAVYIQTTTSGPYTLAKGFLFGGVDTGIGENYAQGAQSVIVLSNAMLYNGLVFNYDSEAQTDLGSSTSGQFIILK